MDLFKQINGENFTVLVVDGDNQSLQLYDNYANTQFSGSIIKTEEGGYYYRIQDSFFNESKSFIIFDGNRIMQELLALDESFDKIRAAMSDYRLNF